MFLFILLTFILTGIFAGCTLQRAAEFAIGDRRWTLLQLAQWTLFVAVLCLMWSQIAIHHSVR